MKLLFTSLPPRNGHVLFCDGNFCKPIKCGLLCVLIHVAVQLESNKKLTNRGDRVTTHGFAEAMEWEVFGAEDGHFWRSLCGPEINTQTQNHQMELQLSVSNGAMISEEKRKFPLWAQSHSRLRVSAFQTSYVTRLRCCGMQSLDSTLQRVYSCSILPLTSSVQPDCSAFSIQPCSSERAHILKCREMWKWNLPDAAFCDITNFHYHHTLTYFLTLIVALEGPHIDLGVQRKSLHSLAFLINGFLLTKQIRDISLWLWSTAQEHWAGPSLLSHVLIPVSNEKSSSHNVSFWSQNGEKVFRRKSGFHV